MPYTLTFEPSGIVYCESIDDWNDADTLPEGLALHRFIATDSNGDRMNGPRKIEGERAVAVTDQEFRAAERVFRHVGLKGQLRGDKIIPNAVLRTVRRANRRSLAAIETAMDAALVTMRAVINTKLPTNITPAEWKPVRDRFAAALRAGRMTPQQAQQLWEASANDLNEELQPVVTDGDD